MAKVSFSVQDLLGLAEQQDAPAHMPAASVVQPAPREDVGAAPLPRCSARTKTRATTIPTAGDVEELQDETVESSAHTNCCRHTTPNSARCHQPARGSTGRTPSPNADDQPSSATGSESEEEDETRTKRARTAYTREQLQMMELSFRTCPYPDSHSRKEIAKRLGITEGKVQVWFQNRRAKYRKRQRPFQKALALPQPMPSLPLFPSPSTSSPSPTYPHLRPSPYPTPFPSFPGLKAPLPFTPSLPLPPYAHLPFPYPPLTNYTSTFPTNPPPNMYTSITPPKHH